jgi:uncharacterized RmlC-like cupin family protein
VVEKIEVVANSELQVGPVTPGMVRSQAFATEGLWVGEVHGEGHAISGWHHHGEHTTCGRVIAGSLRFEFGPGGVQTIEAGPGDYFLVPPHLIHREGNPAAEEQVIVVVRTGSGPTVINVEGPDPA